MRVCHWAQMRGQPRRPDPWTPRGRSEDDYRREFEYIEEVFTPLVEKCKKLGRAMRIGTNHGSLSARILSYYGDTPAGMVESAFEFARVCRKHDYHNFLFSMKASNPVVMVQASERLMTCMSRHAKGSLPTDACRTGRLAHTHAGTQVAPCRCASAETLASAFVASPQSLDVPMPP